MSDLNSNLEAMQQSMAQKNQLESVLTEITLASEAARESLKADPKAFIAKHFETELPQSLKIVIHEDTPSELHLVIPAANVDGEELTDEQLADVAGGFGFAIALSKIAYVAAVSILGYYSEKGTKNTTKTLAKGLGASDELAEGLGDAIGGIAGELSPGGKKK